MKFILLLSLLISTLFSAPAYNKMREFKQADGTTFMAKGQGNQNLNWIQTEDGQILRYNQTSKNYEYAVIKNQKLKASGSEYKKSNLKRVKSLQKEDNSLKQAVHNLWSQKNRESQERRHKRD